MTQSEKNTKHSEIYAAKSTDLSTISLLDSSNFKYCILEGNQPLAIIAPNSGYWNMILLQGSKPCELEMGNGIIEIIMGQPIFREAGKGESLRIVSQNPFHKVLLIFIPKNEIPQEIQLSSLLTQNEQGGHKLEDSRILLKITRIQELSQYHDYINQLKLHTSLAELIIYQLEKIRVLDTANISEIKKNHYEKIQLVKNLIDADFSQNHTIAELAKKAGTNEQYLKKYFKLCFGKTVMNYITQAKMEQAKKLILERNYRIADIAIMIGYKHATHFTNAFKKHFGIIPNSLRYTIVSFPFSSPYLLAYL